MHAQGEGRTDTEPTVAQSAGAADIEAMAAQAAQTADVEPKPADRIANIEEAKTKSTTLVVGDWFVDEHWVCGVHRSPTGSRTGQAHLRALHPLKDTVQAFCGAGRSASFLYQVQLANRGFCDQILGLGFWHRQDTDALAELFNPGELPQSPYRLALSPRTPASGITLVNLNDSLHSGLDAGKRDAREYTTRIIRTYRTSEHGLINYERLDWERPQHERGPWTPSSLDHLKRSLKAQLNGASVAHVVVKDMLKGAVTDELIELLAKEIGQDADWYVSSKKWEPSWLGCLPEGKLRLLLVPQVAAREAIDSNKLSCWITPAGQPTEMSLTLLSNLREYVANDAFIVLMPEGFSVLAWAPSPDRQTNEKQLDCLLRSSVEPHGKRLKVDMGCASIFFPALIACMQSKQGLSVDLLRTIVPKAFKATYDWVSKESERITNVDQWEHDQQQWLTRPSFATLMDQSRDACEFGALRTFNLSRETHDWRAAFRDLGIVTDNGVKQLQLWRSMVEIDGFVCCDNDKRRGLQNLVHGIDTFVRRQSDRCSSMLIATPGSGKSFLVRRLAEKAGLRFLAFNITQMRTRSDIIACFDTILSTQAEEPNRRLLVFMDEIDAKLEGGSAYGVFLAPLEDGTYVQGGKTFHLDPCAWIFAGTEDPWRGDTEKGSDFLSRLSLGVITLSRGDDATSPASKPPGALIAEPSRKALSPREQLRRMELQTVEELKSMELQAVENGYMGASMLYTRYPDVRWVSEQVLCAFQMLPQTARLRDIRRFVEDFRYIQYGRVTSKNVPERSPGVWDAECLKAWQDECSDCRFSDEPNVQIVGAGS